MFDGPQKPEKPEPPPKPPTEAEMWRRQRDVFAQRALDLEAENVVLKAQLAAMQLAVAEGENLENTPPGRSGEA